MFVSESKEYPGVDPGAGGPAIWFMPKRRRWTPVDEFEERTIENAAYYTTCEFLGVGKYRRRKFDELSDAIADAMQQPQRLVYAVTAKGRSIVIVRERWPGGSAHR